MRAVSSIEIGGGVPQRHATLVEKRVQPSTAIASSACRDTFPHLPSREALISSSRVMATATGVAIL